MKIIRPYIIELAKTLSGHWYKVWQALSDGSKGKYLGVYPSSTTILQAYPQSDQLTEWIAKEGFHESRQIRDEAGRQGTRIHIATEMLEEGKELFEGDYNLIEWWKINTFARFFNDYHPELIAKEFPVFSKTGKYAGRLDRIYRLNGEITLLDIKSSSAIHENFPLQFASYAKAVEENTDIEVAQTACLLLGAGNEDGYRLVLYPNWKEHYQVFKNVRSVWQYDRFDSKKRAKKPPVLELPEKLKLNIYETKS